MTSKIQPQLQMMFLSMPDDIVVHIAGFLGQVNEVLKLTEVCVAWQRELPSTSPVWDLFLFELGISNSKGSSTRACHSSMMSPLPQQRKRSFSTRLTSNFKRNFIRCAQAKSHAVKSSHQHLLLNVKHIFDKNKRDCKRILEKAIQKHFPSRRDFNVNARSDLLEGYSLLNLAARYGRFSCINYLLKKLHADPHTKDDGGFTPFLNACYRGDLAIVKLLLASGASINDCGCLRGGSPQSAWHWAQRSKYPSAAREVLQLLQSYEERELTMPEGWELPTEDEPQWCICGHNEVGSKAVNLQ